MQHDVCHGIHQSRARPRTHFRRLTQGGRALMATPLAHETRYDGAGIDQVYAMLADPEFRRRVCDLQGVLRSTVEIVPDGAGMKVRIDQVQAAAGVPSVAKKFVGEQVNIVQEENWASPRQATLTVTIPGKPGEVNGTISLREVDGGVTETVRAEVKVALPLVGAKIEKLIAGLLVKALRAEGRVGRDYLD